MLLLLFSGYRISKYANKKYKFGDQSCRLCLWMVMFIDIKYKSCLTNSINLLQFVLNISLLLLKRIFLLRFQWYIMLNFLFSLLLFDTLRYSLLPLFLLFYFFLFLFCDYWRAFILLSQFIFRWNLDTFFRIFYKCNLSSRLNLYDTVLFLLL